MLSQRCTSLFKATSPATRRAPPRLPQPRPHTRHHLPSRPSPSSPRPSTFSRFHTSTLRHTPATAPPEPDPPTATTATTTTTTTAAAAPPPPPEKPDFLNEAESVVWDRLVKALDPVELVVQDVSGGCGSMYAIEIASEEFRGANMLKQQRMVNAVLGDLLKSWHGCQLKTRVP